MMTPKLKDTWLQALRSGRYKQGKVYLKRGGAYCCLGVLCDVMRMPGYNFKSVAPLRAWALTHDGESVEGHWVSGLPPTLVEEFFAGNSAKMSPEEFQQKCWAMNDSGNKTFSEIADWLEENL